jgi:Tfp pilus assembly protein PilF
VLQDGIKLDAKHVRLYFRLGVVYDKSGNKDDSIETMKKLIQLDPKNANALNYLGYTYADLGKNLDEAERLVKEALTYKPDDGYITDSLGWVYYKKGKYDKALELLKKAASLVPEDPIILEHLGDAYLKKNNEAKALEYYKRSLLHQKKDKGDIQKKIQNLTRKES